MLVLHHLLIRSHCMKRHYPYLYPFMIVFGLLILLSPINTLGTSYPIPRLVVGTTMTVNSINIDDYYYGVMRAMLTHRALVQLDEKGAIVADMAETWKTDDAQKWIFHLRPDLVWHDGKAVTARDVAFSMRYLLEKIPVYRWHLKLVDKIEARDDHTVVLDLTEPNPRFLVNLLVLRVIPRHIFETVEDPKKFHGPRAAIGCGPYKFKAFDKSAGVIRFEAFEQYYRGKPNVGEVVFRLFRNADTLNLSFRKGEVDLPYFYASGTDPVQARTLKNNPEVKLHLINNRGVPNMLFFNLKQPMVDRPEFREALSYAINYQELLNLFAAGYGSVPNKGFIPPGTFGFVKTEPFAFDPKTARQKLRQLGYVDTNNDGIREADNRNLELEIVVRTDTDGSMRLADRLKTYFSAVGIALKIKPVDNTLFRQISDRDRNHTILLSRTTPWGMMMWAGCGSGYIDSRNIGWSVMNDPEFLAIVDRMNAASNDKAYLQAAADFQAYNARMTPVIPLYWNQMIQPYHKRFSGWLENPMYGFLWEKTWFSLKANKN